MSVARRTRRRTGAVDRGPSSALAADGQGVSDFALTPERRRSIHSLALPIIGAMASQNLVNLVDTAMVGTLGDRALAAVGLAGFVNFMAVSFMMGMSSGVQAMCARWKGAGRFGEIAIPLNGGLLLAVLVCMPATAILLAVLPALLAILAPEPAVADIASEYLGWRILGMTAVAMNFAFRGYWNAVNLSRLYMTTLLAMHACNIALNWVLIFGNLGAPALGAEGAGIANAIATWFGSGFYFAFAMRHGRGEGFLAGLPSQETMRAMLRTSLPAGFQQLLFAAGMTALFAILGRVGTAEVAAGNVLIQVMLVTILPSIGFGLAAATLVGQALGAGDRDEAYAWAWRVARLANVVVCVLAVPAVFAPELVLSPFLHDPATRALAAWPLRIAALTAPLECVSSVLLNAHLGAGSSRTVLAVSVATQWGVFLPMAWLLGPVAGFGLVAIWAAQAGYRLLGLGLFAWSWERKTWASVRL